MKNQDLINILVIGWIVWFISVILGFVLFKHTLFFPALITSGYLSGAFLLNPDKKIYSRFWLFLSFVWDLYFKFMKSRFSNLNKMYVINSACQLFYLALIILLSHALFYTFMSIFSFLIKPLEIGDTLNISWVLFIKNPMYLLTWILGVFCGNTIILHLDND